MALGPEVVDLIGLDLAQDRHEGGGVAQVAVVQRELGVPVVRVGVQMIEPSGVQAGGPADDAVHLVPLLDEKLGQERSILTGDAGDERRLHEAEAAAESTPRRSPVAWARNHS